MTLDVVAIRDRLPHRYPFLLLDRVIELEEGRRAVGIKNVTVNEPFFNGHFPVLPVMPGVLVLEALAQLAGVVLYNGIGSQGKIPLFAGIDNARFRRVVHPGDQLRLEVDVMRARRGSGKVSGKAYVDGELAAEADLFFFAGDVSAARAVISAAEPGTAADASGGAQ